MSAQFILEYAGAPVCFNRGVELVPEHQADRFVAEQDAWWAAYQAGLNPDRCRVVNLYLRSLQTTANKNQP